MKKTAFLLLGLITFSAGAVMFSSDASRADYHEYLRMKSFSGRSAGETNIREQLSKASRYRETRHFHRMNYLFPTYNKRDHYSRVSPSTEQFNTRPVKTTSYRTGAFQTSNTATPVLLTRAVKIQGRFEEVHSDNFSVEVPSSWKASSTGTTLKVDTNNDVIFSVEMLDNISCKDTLSFEFCGRSIIKTENRTKEKEILLTIGKTINVEANIFDNQLGDRSDYNFFEQTQLATYGKTEFIVINRIVESKAGELYLLEVIAPKLNASYTVSLTKKIFDTFRIK